MCLRCYSSANPFESKPVVLDGVDANKSKEEQIGGQEWEKDPQTRDRFMKYAESYMEWVLEEYRFDVLTRDMIDFRDSGRMSRLLGRCDEKAPYEVEIILSWEAYKKRNYDWERLRNTVKHELVHASNFVENGYMGHGPTFISEAKRLDVTNIGRYDEPDPRWFIVCNNCGLVLWRQKKSKKVKDAQATGRIGWCGNCRTNDWDVLQDAPAQNHPKWVRS